MSEYRQDPIYERCVVVARERGARPGAFAASTQGGEGGFCPFCEGHEDETPAELWAVRPQGTQRDAAGWLVRVVPNKYPALSLAAGLRAGGTTEPAVEPGLGAHEVIVESPRHVVSLSDFTLDEIALVLSAYRDRLAALAADRHLALAQVFKNVGRMAGASVEHARSQLIATTHVPPEAAMRHAAARRALARLGGCAFCALLARELADGSRVVFQSEQFVALCPYASRLPYETWLLPRRHAARFEQSDDATLAALAEALQSAVCRLEDVLDRPAYNVIIHTAPYRSDDAAAAWHWHLELVPRLTQTAGFEWATGLYINPVPPEDAAAQLRSAVVGTLRVPSKSPPDADRRLCESAVRPAAHAR